MKLSRIAILIALLVLQTSCSKAGVTPTLPAAAETESSMTDTPVSTNTPLPPTTTPGPLIKTTGTWSEEPPMLTPRSAHAVVSSGCAIYALAGTDEHGRPVLDVEVFDGKEWKVETTLPGNGLNAPTASLVGDKLYVMGGFKAVSNLPTNEAQVYDLQMHQWSDASPLPNPRGGHAAVVLEGRIHLLGGGNSVSTVADHSVFDPRTNKWSELAPLPRDEGSPAAVVVAGKIYAIGGRSGYSDFGDVYIYDPAADSWSAGPAIEPRGTAGAVGYCGAIYLFGGESQAERRNLDSVLRLDLDGSEWEAVTPLPAPRKFARAVLFQGAIYIVGGSTVLASSHAPVGTTSVERFTQDGCS
jgi:N-acetylneuraminic acid mutarotase